VTGRRALILLAAGLASACGTAGTTSGPAPLVPSASASAGLSSRPVGATFRISAISPEGRPATYTVVLLSVNEDVAPPPSSSPGLAAGEHLVSAQFRITGVTGSASENADIDASVSGTNKKEYHPASPGGTAGTGSGPGTFSVSAGRTEIRNVTFQLPAGVLAATVIWRPSLVGSGGTWAVG
jgi:hypothetical protein